MAENLKHLFKVSSTEMEAKYIHNKRSNTAAPTLNPLRDVNWSAHESGRYVDPQLIDVVNGFEWTHTPEPARLEVPYVRMSEYEVEFSTLLQQIRYIVTMGEETIKNLSESAQERFKSVKKMAEGGGAVEDWILRKSPEMLKKGATAGKNYTTFNTPKSIPDYLKPYYGLYGTQGTGFEYVFPYFESQWKEVAPRWEEFKGGGGLFSSFVSELFMGEGIGKDITDMFKFAPGAKGTYIERPYEYQYGRDMPTWTFKFNLLNTADYNDVVKNWQLCYLLSYQNLPNKTTKTLLDPPVIYEVEVPSTFYSPYAYISRLSIQNRGAMRLARISILKDKSGKKVFNIKTHEHNTMSREEWLRLKEGSTPWKSLKAPGGDKKQVKIQQAMGYEGTGQNWNFDGTEEISIETVIPDAYEVSITIQSLVPESKNLLFHSILGPGARADGVYNVSLNNPDELLDMRNVKSKSTQHLERYNVPNNPDS